MYHNLKNCGYLRYDLGDFTAQQSLTPYQKYHTLLKFNCPLNLHIRVGWVPCHHSMACSQVAEGGKPSGYGG